MFRKHWLKSQATNNSGVTVRVKGSFEGSGQIEHESAGRGLVLWTAFEGDFQSRILYLGATRESVVFHGPEGPVKLPEPDRAAITNDVIEGASALGFTLKFEPVPQVSDGEADRQLDEVAQPLSVRYAWSGSFTESGEFRKRREYMAENEAGTTVSIRPGVRPSSRIVEFKSRRIMDPLWIHAELEPPDSDAVLHVRGSREDVTIFGPFGSVDMPSVEKDWILGLIDAGVRACGMAIRYSQQVLEDD